MRTTNETRLTTDTLGTLQAAAFAMGADGINMGTRFMATKEVSPTFADIFYNIFGFFIHACRILPRSGKGVGL